MIRKLGHWTEYLILAVLTMRAMHKQTGRNWELRHAVHTLIFILIYALSDELHQVLVPSRTASLGDVMTPGKGSEQPQHQVLSSSILPSRKKIVRPP